LTVNVIAKVRPGSDPLVGGTPGYHQIVLVDRPRASDSNLTSGALIGPNGERSGDWGANEAVTTWAHETGHLLGLPDRYSAGKPEFVAPDGTRYKLPEYTGKAGDVKAMDAWWEMVLKQSAELEKEHGKGDIEPSIPAGSENDIMSGGNGKDNAKQLSSSDVDRLIANAGVHLHADPGDVLLNKDSNQQNMVVGAAFDLYAPEGGKAHRNGLYAYCTDLNRHLPGTESRFDVLGPAGAQGGAYPQYLALQLVAEEIARRQVSTGNLIGGPPGANSAIWAITDGLDPMYDDDARSILAAAGVTFDPVSFSASPHFNDPNTHRRDDRVGDRDGRPAERPGRSKPPARPGRSVCAARRQAPVPRAQHQADSRGSTVHVDPALGRGRISDAPLRQTPRAARDLAQERRLPRRGDDHAGSPHAGHTPTRAPRRVLHAPARRTGRLQAQADLHGGQSEVAQAPAPPLSMTHETGLNRPNWGTRGTGLGRLQLGEAVGQSLETESGSAEPSCDGSVTFGRRLACQAGSEAIQWLWSSRRLWVAAISRHSDRTAALPLRLKRSHRRLDLISPNTGSIVSCRWR
jgi:hypothetical protein